MLQSFTSPYVLFALRVLDESPLLILTCACCIPPGQAIIYVLKAACTKAPYYLQAPITLGTLH